MNRRRTQKRQLGAGSVALLIAAAVFTAGAGVFHAYVKNRQIHVARKINDTEQRIRQAELRIKTTQILLDEQMNRYLIRDRLRRIPSELKPIAIQDLKEIDPNSNPKRSLPDLAQEGP